MTRKKKDFTREILPDPKFHDVVVTKVVNSIMRGGKKSVAEKALYDAFHQTEQKTGEPALDTFNKALANIRPIVEVRSRRVGGATYQVPTEVGAKRGQSLAVRWLIASANSRSERRISDRLANELMEAAVNRGAAVKKREDTHRMAEANKAFAHFRW